MEKEKTAEFLTNEIERLIRDKMGSVFPLYGMDIADLFIHLKWKPLVLIVGNYSSGKSTFINEILGTRVQRTGQAPTDDSFTILASTEKDEGETKIPGSTVVSDERLPFSSLRQFGESLLSHLHLKKVNASILQNIAIIDSPGMLDSVTEKDRGYDYLGVVGELAKIADLIILMFDPYKAGTIKETYQAIRSILPGSTGEDRILYVLNRIDECKSVADLMRSYGTLCWNLSQMTGRKDMPRIYLAYSQEQGNVPPNTEAWINDRDELIEAMKTAPEMRLNHILQEVDKNIRELSLRIESMATFRMKLIQNLKTKILIGGMAALFTFFFGDLIMKVLTGYPETPLYNAFVERSAGIEHFLWPFVLTLFVLSLALLYIRHIVFPKFMRNNLKNLDNLIPLETSYRKDLWKKVKHHVHQLMKDRAMKHIWIAHGRQLAKTQHFLEKDLRRLFEQIQSD